MYYNTTKESTRPPLCMRFKFVVNDLMQFSAVALYSNEKVGEEKGVKRRENSVHLDP